MLLSILIYLPQSIALRILLLDNYDSFTFNLYHLIEKISGAEIDVVKNDEVDLDVLSKYDGLIISPGPGLPTEAGKTMELLKKHQQTKKILGVCLGHQAIAQFFGAKLKNLEDVVHGRKSTIQLVGNDVFTENMPRQFEAGRYHSWVVDTNFLPKELVVLGKDASGEIMLMRHATLPIFGVQYHPESILTAYGEQLLENWLKI